MVAFRIIRGLGSLEAGAEPFKGSRRPTNPSDPKIVKLLLQNEVELVTCDAQGDQRCFLCDGACVALFETMRVHHVRCVRPSNVRCHAPIMRRFPSLTRDVFG